LYTRQNGSNKDARWFKVWPFFSSSFRPLQIDVGMEANANQEKYMKTCMKPDGHVSVFMGLSSVFSFTDSTNVRLHDFLNKRKAGRYTYGTFTVEVTKDAGARREFQCVDPGHPATPRLLRRLSAEKRTVEAIPRGTSPPFSLENVVRWIRLTN
jgi:hypothetical protein